MRKLHMVTPYVTPALSLFCLSVICWLKELLLFDLCVIIDLWDQCHTSPADAFRRAFK